MIRLTVVNVAIIILVAALGLKALRAAAGLPVAGGVATFLAA